MEINAEVVSSEHYTVTINNGDYVIQTITSVSEDAVNQWLHEVERLYIKKRNNSVVGLCAESNPNNANLYKRPPLDQPYDLLQLCIGSHCLLIDLNNGVSMTNNRALKEFLSNPLITFVGVDIDETVQKFEKETNLKVAKTMDLSRLARQALQKFGLGYTLEGLADSVLGYHMVVEKPKKIKWIHGNKLSQGNRACGSFSVEKVMYSTVDVFLSYEIGDVCMKMILRNIDRQSSSKKSSSSS